MNHCKLFFSMALSGMVLFSSTFAQSYGDGSVSTGQNEPVKQAQVDIVHQDNADSQTVYTDDQGDFEFNGLYTSIDEVTIPDGIEVMANPGSVHGVRYATPEQDDGIAQLYGVNGQLVDEVPVDSHDGVTTARFGEDLSLGMYLYRDGEEAVKLVHTRYGPRASQPSPVLKSAASRDVYTFTITPQDGESNVLFDETASDQNLESGYNTVDLSVEPTAFMHSVSGDGNVSGAELTFENDGNTIFQTTTDSDGSYQTGSEYLDNRTEDYNITITPPGDDYESLDTLITRNWNEGEGSTFDFTLNENTPDYYENEEVRGFIDREEYPYEGNYTAITNAKVKFEGINIDYADSTIMDDDPYYQVFGLHIPVNNEGEPEPAQYLQTVTPIDTTESQIFLPYSDTVTITTETFGMPYVYTKEYPQYVYFQGNISDVLAPDQKISGASVIAYNPDSGEEYAQASTDSEGNYTLDDYIPSNTTFAFKVGWTSGEDTDYLSSVGHEYTTRDQIVWDTTSTVNWGLVPKEVELPATENDPNHGMMVTVDPEKVEDLIRGPPASTVYVGDTEEARERKVNLYVGGLSSEDKETLRIRIREADSMLYAIEKSKPIDAEERPFNLVYDTYDPDNQLPMPGNYHPVDNYHPGELGWAVYYGSPETWATSREFDNNKTYPESGVVGGTINTTFSESHPQDDIKELYYRTERRQNVTGYNSIMNPDPTPLTFDDRANTKIIHANEKQRWTFDEEGHSNTYYPADKLEYSIDAE